MKITNKNILVARITNKNILVARNLCINASLSVRARIELRIELRITACMMSHRSYTSRIPVIPQVEWTSQSGDHGEPTDSLAPNIHWRTSSQNNKYIDHTYVGDEPTHGKRAGVVFPHKKKTKQRVNGYQQLPCAKWLYVRVWGRRMVT